MPKTTTKSPIRPLRDRIVVKRDETKDRTPGGILLPEVAQKKVCQGTVIAVGLGEIDQSSKRIPMEVNVGDRVAFTNYAGNEWGEPEDNLLIMSERDILGVIEE